MTRSSLSTSISDWEIVEASGSRKQTWFGSSKRCDRVQDLTDSVHEPEAATRQQCRRAE